MLCDDRLPGTSGYDVARALRAERMTVVPMIAVPGHAQPEGVAKATDAGPTGTWRSRWTRGTSSS